jgi:hypothetical protein
MTILEIRLKGFGCSLLIVYHLLIGHFRCASGGPDIFVLWAPTFIFSTYGKSKIAFTTYRTKRLYKQGL